MGPSPKVRPDYSDANDAKDLLDKIGEEIYKKAKDEALTRSGSRLKGFLTSAIFSNGHKVTNKNPCNLNYQYDTTVSWGVINPCNHKSEERFSEVSGGECDDNKIEGNVGSTGKEVKSAGACAPFRRLHVCDRNLEKITDTNTTTTHNLLVDVCMAAQFEGKSISGYYPKYEVQYPGSGFTLCTMLARSFADIGDIIRGKDLFRGYNETDKEHKVALQQHLKEIFKKIHDKLDDTVVQKHYSDDDKGTKNYYKLREDWWTLNRQEVWYAITCGAHEGDTYFRRTCSKGTTNTSEKCRCAINDVPTYFDYVPQYLRWFEEWAEDFCRKRKYKLKDLIKKCRYDEEDKPKYCDRNGYDCEKTIRGKNQLVEGDECHKCSIACTNFVNWIKNQKQEFLKQREKYTQEMEKYANGASKGTTTTTKETSNGSINNLYVQDFYERLNQTYGDVNKFLQKLNDETTCKELTQVLNETASKVDFSERNFEKTFSHKEYCDTCAWCAKKIKDEKGKWTDIPHIEGCPNEQSTPFDVSNTTEIHLLSTEKGKSNILDKYKNLCNSNGKKETQTWKCHFESSKKNYCVQAEGKTFTEGHDFKSYESFFSGWINEMLEDSIKWRNEHGKCINDAKSGKCRKGCKNPCECFQKWIDKKKTEWDEIEKHFDKQKDTANLDHYTILQSYLSFFFKEDIIKAYGEEKCNELMESFRNFQVSKEIKDTQHSNDAIKILFKHEEDEAKTCLDTHKIDPCPQSSTPEGAARSATSSPPVIPRNDFPDEKHKQPEFKDLEDDEEEEEKEEEEKEEDEGAVDSQQPEAPPEPKDKVNPCQIVQTLFEKPQDFKDVACTQKYGLPQRHWGWKCVTSGGSDSGVPTTSGSSDATASAPTLASPDVAASANSANTVSSAVCIPPRRRKLYVGGLTKWASDTVGNTGESQTQPQVDTTSQSQKLLEAFIESAAVETFFLWHRYKKIKDKEIEEKKRRDQEANGLGLGYGGVGVPGELGGGGPIPPILPVPPGFPPAPQVPVGSDDPQTLLQSGTIPPPFLRQMFYTLADYKDILFGDQEVIKALEASGDKNIETIKKAIESVFNSGNNQESGRSPSLSVEKTTPKDWWDKNAKDIWKGMIYALTYKDSEQKGDGRKPEKDSDVYEKIFGKDNKAIPGKPDNPGTTATPTGTQKGTFEEKYQYNSVKLKEENSGTEAISNDPINNPTLKDFVLRPTYFRWLEEWGETFCRQRTRMLEKIKQKCKVEDDDNKCSGDGYDCKITYLKRDDMFKDVNCPDCVKECRKYKKWIDIKFEEYNNQKSKYDGELQKLPKDNNCSGDDNKNFCKQIQEHTTVDKFLKELKHCKDDQTDGEKDEDYDKNKIDFSNPQKMFNPSTYCKACPLDGVNCLGKKGCIPKSEKDQNNAGGQSTGIDVFINYGATKDIDEKVQNFCTKYGLYKNSKIQKWKCQNINDIYKCQRQNPLNSEYYDDNIPFKILFERWIRDFVENYNKSKERITRCTNDVNSCKQGCKGNCDCVEEWLKNKSTEWEIIKKYYKENLETPDERIASRVKSFLEQGPFNTYADEAKKVVEKPCDKEKLWGCTGKNYRDDDPKKCDNDNFITNLIKALQKKISVCKSQHDPQTKRPCHPPSRSGETPTPLEDDDEPLEEEENENPVGKHPSFCNIEKKAETVDEGGCDAPENEKKKDEKKEEQEDDSEKTSTSPTNQEIVGPAPPADSGEKKNPKEAASVPTGSPPSTPEAPIPPSRPQPTPELLEKPHVLTALVTSTLAWSVGIGFATFTYFYLKVLYIYIYICICAFCVGVFGYIYMYIYVYVYICLYVYVFLYMYLWGVFGCIYIYLCICGCICVSVYVCMGVFGYIYMCMYIYVFYIYFIYMYLY